MALLFNAAVNCGTDEDAARAIAAAFAKLTIHITPEVATTCETSVGKGNDGFWQVYIQPDGAWYGRGQRVELMSPEARAIISGVILENLKACRGFLVAITGEESQDWIDFPPGPQQIVPPMVVRADMRELLPSKMELEPFSPGYLWAPR